MLWQLDMIQIWARPETVLPSLSCQGYWDDHTPYGTRLLAKLFGGVGIWLKQNAFGVCGTRGLFSPSI